MEKLYFIRHAESEANAAKRIAGSQESPLTENGRAQAEKTGEKLADGEISFDHIISSPLERARDTAEIFAKHLNFSVENIKIDNNVRERCAGELEGKLKSEAKTQDGSEIVIMGESPAEFCVRALQFWQEAQKLEGNVLLVAHSGVGKVLDTALKGGQPKDMFKHPGFKNADDIVEISPEEITAPAA